MDLDAVYEVRLSLCVAASVTDLHQHSGPLPDFAVLHKPCREHVARAMYNYSQISWCCRLPAPAAGLLSHFHMQCCCRLPGSARSPDVPVGSLCGAPYCAAQHQLLLLGSHLKGSGR